LHQGCPDHIPGSSTKSFIGAFAHAANKDSWGLLPEGATNTYLQQMTRYLNGNEYTTGMEIEDLGDYHWSVLFTRFLGFSFGTLLPRLPFGLGETLLFNIHTKNIRKQLDKRGTPTGHGAGTGEDIGGAATEPVKYAQSRL